VLHNTKEQEEQPAMPLEIMQLSIRPGTDEQFTDAWNSLCRVVDMKEHGIETMRLLKAVQAPNQFALLIEWADPDAHERFTTTDAFASFSSVVAAALAEPPTAGDYLDLA
jgi:heme-degrading monooxygenase HmoA